MRGYRICADGDLDLAVARPRKGVWVLLNEGSTGDEWNGFSTPTPPIPMDGAPQNVTSGDWDNDGDMDVVIGTGRESVRVLLNKGVSNGQWEGFIEPDSYRAGNHPSNVTTGDVDSDGDLDIVVGNYFSGDVSVLLGNGDGSFEHLDDFPVGNRGNGGTFQGVQLDDLDGDGVLDVAVAVFKSPIVAVLFGNGDGTFAERVHQPISNIAAGLRGGDFDKDGDFDLLVIPYNGSRLHLLINHGDGTFDEQEDALFGGVNPQGGAVADFDGDGRLDLAISTAFQNGLNCGNCGVEVWLNTTELPPTIISGDSNMDDVFDQLDIVTVLQSAKYLTGEPATFEQGDWNGDGVFDQLDIITALATGTYLTHAQATHRGSPHGGGGGNGGNVGGDVAGYIYSKLTLDGTNGLDSNVIISDGDPNGIYENGEYEHGMQNTEIFIGRNFNMVFDFHDREKKTEERTISFLNGFPVPAMDTACGDAPTFSKFDVIDPPVSRIEAPGVDLMSAGSAELTIGGQDFDDLPFDDIQQAFATLSFSDENGQGWTVYFGDLAHPHPGGSTPAPCGSLIEVKRLDNVDGADPGISQWEISTTGTGYLYRDRDKPNSDIEFYGIVSLPFSGTVESLTEEPLPS